MQAVQQFPKFGERGRRRQRRANCKALGLFAGSAIHDGNPPIVPSGNSQKMYSPFGSFARRSTRRL